MGGTFIKLENVSWAYSRAHNWALTHINMEIGEGECLAVTGDNGAGKTSFCRLLNGLIPHSLPGKLLGAVTVDGVPTTANTLPELSQKIGTVFEDPKTQLFTATVHDEVAFALENMLMPPEQIREKIRWALGATGLADYADFPPSALSGGQKQRLAIAAALAMAEKALVLDEPCSQLDPQGAQEILSLIRELRAQKGLTVVMATNSPEEADGLADRVCVLEKGSITIAPRLRGVDGIMRQASAHNISHRIQQGSPTLGGHVRRGEKENVLEISHLHYEYIPGSPILNDINLNIKENEFTAITGRNGCGKTTLLKNIVGLQRPTQGNILLRGADTARMDTHQIAGEIGFVMQDPDHQLFESSVYDEVAFALKRAPRRKSLTKHTIREKTEEALSNVDLLDKRNDFPLALNRADRVKTVFAAILAMGPRIIMLDEPIAGQDMKGCRLIMELLADLYQQGYTIVMVTHNEKVIEEYAQRVIEIKDGICNNEL